MKFHFFSAFKSKHPGKVRNPWQVWVHRLVSRITSPNLVQWSVPFPLRKQVILDLSGGFRNVRMVRGEEEREGTRWHKSVLQWYQLPTCRAMSIHCKCLPTEPPRCETDVSEMIRIFLHEFCCYTFEWQRNSARPTSSQTPANSSQV